MSLMNWFNKPKWKSKDVDIRLIAVKNDQSSDLITELPNIIRNDDSEEVRLAALKRINDYELMAQIAKTDSSNEIKNTAVKLLSDWIQKETSEDQIDIIKQLNNPLLNESAARHSKNPEIRRHCIDLISKQGLLAELVINEPNVELRQLIAEKINKPATLKRVAKALKNKDKSLSKSLHERLESKGDQNRLRDQKASFLCQQLEQLIHSLHNNDMQKVTQLQDQWKALSESYDLSSFQQRFEGALQTAKVTLDPEQRNEFLTQQRIQRVQSKLKELESAMKHAPSMEWKELQAQIGKYSGFDLSHAELQDKERYESILDELKALRDEKSKEFALPDRLLKVVDDLEKSLKHKFNQPQQIKTFRNQWDQNFKQAPNSSALQTLKIRFDNAMTQLAENVEASANKRDEAAKKAVADIDKVSKLIKDGHLAEAKIAINKIAENKRIAAQHQLIQKNKFAFDSLWNELKELRKWQKWSNDEIRVRMIQDLKSLVGTGTHPDTLLKKMKESNKAWKELEDSEKLEGDKFGVRNMELWAQFREVQKALFEPAQPYFEKRSEIWNKELESVEKDIKDMKEIDLQETSDRDLARMVRAAAGRLRSLDKIPPNKRGACASGLRAGIKRLDDHLSESYDIAARRKEKLIDAANELIELEDLDTAIEQAKALQAEWKEAGIVNQNRERKLWKNFRKANDAIFNRLKQKKNEEKQANNEVFESAKTLIAETRSQLDNENTSQGIHSLIEVFKDKFNELDIRSVKLNNQAKELIHSASDTIHQMESQESREALKDLANKAELCQKLELGLVDQNEAQDQWSQLPSVQDNKAEKLIQKRWKQATKSKANTSFVDQATQFLVASEYLTGTATPEADKELRLNYQVEVLAKRMSGEESMSVSQQASDLLTQWYVLPGSEKEFLDKNKKRIDSVVNHLYELITG
jgi:exonuclease SbcC